MSSVLSSIDFGGGLISALYWSGYIVLVLIILGMIFTLWYLLSFNIKVNVLPLYGSGKDGIFSVQKAKKNRVKWIKKHSAWRKMWPLFNRKELEPFDSEYIYPGNQVYAFEINNEWIPGRINIQQTEKELRSQINPVPHFIRNWQSLQHKKDALEFASNNWWDENKPLIIAILTVAICCATCLISVYLTYKYLAPGRADWASLLGAIRSVNTIPGVGPGG